jgi:YgiT-type zinc finger domain-containing protein
VDHAQGEKETVMICTIQGCPGEYEARTIAHTVKYHGALRVIDHVPAEVCTEAGVYGIAPQWDNGFYA